MVVVINSIRSQLLHVKVRIVARDDGIELLIAEHGQPLRPHHLDEPPPEQPRLLLDLPVALKVRVAHHELHLVFTR